MNFNVGEELARLDETRADYYRPGQQYKLMKPPPLEIAVYYYPQYHPDPRNDRWHGKGWTEWELVKRAEPRFPGHRQPRVPLWGYTDESDPIYAEREIALAADHGVTTFLFDYYHYDDGPFLEGALTRIFKGAESEPAEICADVGES